MSCELRDVSKEMALHSGVYFSSLYLMEEGHAAQGSACLPLSEILRLPQRIIISTTCYVNLVNSNTVAPALAQSLLSSHLWSMISFGHRLSTLSASLLGMGSFQTLVPKQRLLLRVKHGEIFFSNNVGRNTEHLSLSYSPARAMWVETQQPCFHSLIDTCHPINVEAGSDNCWVLGHHTLML